METTLEEIYPNAYIYLITVVEKQSKLFGKQYVGKCNGNDKYYITGGKIIKSVIKKYGLGSFNKEIIVKQPMTLNQLNELEKFYIDYYNTLDPNGLNLTVGGDGGSNISFIKYTWYHKDYAPNGVELTQYELRTKYKLYKSTISSVILNKVNMCKGWSLNKDIADNYIKKDIFTWYHKDYAPNGIELTQNELIKKYKLNKGTISLIASGKVNQRKGWKIYKKDV